MDEEQTSASVDRLPPGVRDALARQHANDALREKVMQLAVGFIAWKLTR